MLDRTLPPEVKGINLHPMPDVETTILSNGMSLHTLSRGSADVCRLSIVIQGGEAEAPSASVAQLSAKLLVEGAGNKSGAEVAEVLDREGAWISTKADSHHRTVTLFSLTRNLPSLLPLLCDMLVRPKFEASEFDIYRERLARTLATDLTKPSYHASKASEKAFFGNGHPFSRDESPDDIRNILASETAKFHFNSLRGSNIHLYLAGNLTPGLCDMVACGFDALNLCAYGHDKRLVPPDSELSGRKRVDVALPGVKQSAVSILMPAIPRSSPDYEALRMAVIGLGGYFGSRLMANIREDKGMTYGITASLLGYHECGAISVTTQTDSIYLNRIIDEIESELRRMSSEPLSDDELKRLRNYVALTLASQLDSPFSAIDYHESHVTAGTPHDYFERQMRALATLDADIIASLSSRYLKPDNMIIATAGE